MAKKTTDRDLTPVTLVTTDVMTPYRAGEVFTVPKYMADALMSGERTDDEGKTVSFEVKVRLFDPKTDAELLAQYGESVDAPKPEVPKAA